LGGTHRVYHIALRKSRFETTSSRARKEAECAQKLGSLSSLLLRISTFFSLLLTRRARIKNFFA
jgi:hypothetical protein